MITMRWSTGAMFSRLVGRTVGQADGDRRSGGPPVRQSAVSRIIAVARGQWSRHHSGGGHTASSHTRVTPAVPSAQRRAFLGFASAMSLDLATLRRRLQKALGKEFTVGDLLGEGGFAAVFRVRDKSQNRDVAVKVLDLGLTHSPGLAERFVREARTSGQLEHPHIVPIYKVGGYKNEVLYIVMRCVDGPSVRQLLEREQRLSVVDAARIARQLADALGVVLYQMLAGTPPFEGESAQSVLMKQATVDAVPIRQLRGDVPAALAGVIERMLAKNPADRYQTAEELSRALVDALPGAARDGLHTRRGIVAGVVRVLVGVGAVAGLGLVAFAVFSRAPRLAVSAPVPDSLTQALRRQRALPTGDVALYVFAPRGTDDTTLLLVTRRVVSVVTPHRVRVYPRDSVRARYQLSLRGGLAFRMILSVQRAREDTAFRSLSIRDVYEMTPRLRQLRLSP